ncbi:hypothetical protein C8R44DRAFT_874589 [Mycena epipterygia]|nr:hypothetical protein C8R44DRAFT_874589 [Mycena epipterygia]
MSAIVYKPHALPDGYLPCAVQAFTGAKFTNFRYHSQDCRTYFYLVFGGPDWPVAVYTDYKVSKRALNTKGSIGEQFGTTGGPAGLDARLAQLCRTTDCQRSSHVAVKSEDGDTVIHGSVEDSCSCKSGDESDDYKDNDYDELNDAPSQTFTSGRHTPNQNSAQVASGPHALNRNSAQVTSGPRALIQNSAQVMSGSYTYARNRNSPMDMSWRDDRWWLLVSQKYITRDKSLVEAEVKAKQVAYPRASLYTAGELARELYGWNSVIFVSCVDGMVTEDSDKAEARFLELERRRGVIFVTDKMELAIAMGTELVRLTIIH